MSDPHDGLSPKRFHDLSTVIAPAVLTPDFDDVYRLARHRRTRRTTLAALACVAAVAAVTVAVTAPIAGLRLGQSSEDQPAGKASEGPRRVTTPYTAGGNTIDFLSPSTGYWFSYRCPDPPGRCEFRLQATGDGGRTWQPRPVPGPPMPVPNISPEMIVLGPRYLLLTRGDQRQLSNDGGFHWTPAPTRSAAPVATVTEMKRLRIGCLNADCTRSHLVVVDPATGAEAPLRRQPQLRAMSMPQYPSDGSIWIAGQDIRGQSALATSHDQGQSWTTRPVPIPTDGSADWAPAVTTINGRTAYALGIVGSDARELPIARTDDGGTSWRHLRHLTGPVDPPTVRDAVLLPDGRLAITQQQLRHPGAGPYVVVSSDGVTFHRLASAPPISSFIPFPGGVIGEGDQDDGGRVYLTLDGSTWRPLPVNPGR